MYLMAAKFGVPVCPHAGGVGLCELVQHLSVFDYVAVAGTTGEPGDRVRRSPARALHRSLPGRATGRTCCPRNPATAPSVSSVEWPSSTPTPTACTGRPVTRVRRWCPRQPYADDHRCTSTCSRDLTRAPYPWLGPHVPRWNRTFRFEQLIRTSLAIAWRPRCWCSPMTMTVIPR